MNFRFLVAGCAALAATTVHAGVTVKTASYGRDTTISIQGDKVRIEAQATQAGEGSPAEVVIFDAAAKTLTNVNPVQKTYSVMTEADMRRAGEQMRKQVEKAKEALPPEQRKKLESLMSKRPGDTSVQSKRKIGYEPTGERRTVAGYACQVYRKVGEDKQREEACLIPWSSRTLTKQDLKPFSAFEHFMAAFVEGMGGPPPEGGIVAKELERLPGFPVETAQISPNGERLETEKVVGIERSLLSENLFRPPAGYAQVEAQPFGTQ